MNEYRKIAAAALRLSATALVCAGLVAGCSNPGADVKHYALTGKVVEVDKADQALVVSMDAIPGYMEAMTMSVHVKDAADLVPLAPGDSIRADYVVHANGSWVQRVEVVAKTR